jgi:hypothetical protein
MSTIANLPAADINVAFPSGAVKTVNMIRLLATVQHAETMARFGVGLARNAPTLKAVRDEYEIPASFRTWKQLAPALRRFHDDLRAHILGA